MASGSGIMRWQPGCPCCVDCVVYDDDFSGMDDGKMPIGWDDDSTDWAVSGGMATGNGEICNSFDVEAGQYNVWAWFDLGHLETLGDSVRIELSIGSDYEYLVVTRVSGALPGQPDRLKYESSKNGLSYTVLQDGTYILRVCYDGTVEGSICVDTTQPTLAGHEDAGLSRLTVYKSQYMDPECPPCPGPSCINACIDANTAEYYAVTLSYSGTDCRALSKGVCRCSDYDGTHILSPGILGQLPITGCYRVKMVYMPCEIVPGVWDPEPTPGWILLGFDTMTGPNPFLPLIPYDPDNPYLIYVVVNFNAVDHDVYYALFPEPIDCNNLDAQLSGGVRVRSL